MTSGVGVCDELGAEESDELGVGVCDELGAEVSDELGVGATDELGVVEELGVGAAEDVEEVDGDPHASSNAANGKTAHALVFFFMFRSFLFYLVNMNRIIWLHRR